MLKPPRYILWSCWLLPQPNPYKWKNSSWQVNQKQSVFFFFPLGLCGGHCTVFNLYRSKPYLETLFEVCTLPKEWVYKALGEPAWRHAKHEDLALTHFGFLSFLLGLESSLSLSLSLSLFFLFFLSPFAGCFV